MPQSPSGRGCMTPPMSPCPSLIMSINACRSKLSAIACRSSRLSKGGTSRLTIRLRLTAVGVSSQIACGILLTTSFNSGTERAYRIIAEVGEVAGHCLDLESPIRPIAEFFHEGSCFRPVFLHIRIVAGQRFQHVGRHAPYPFGWRHHH